MPLLESSLRESSLPDLSTLPLFVARIATNDPYDTLTTDDFAVVTDLLDAGSHLHGLFLGCPYFWFPEGHFA